MGLFSKKKEAAKDKNVRVSYYAPTSATTQWFHSDEGRQLFDRIQRDRGFDIMCMKLYWFAYIGTLANIRAINAECADSKKDAVALQLLISKFLAILSLEVETDMFGDTVYTESACYDYLMDTSKSDYLYYVENAKFGMTEKVTKVVCSILINNGIDVYSETWLYDEKVFDLETENEVLQKLGAIIKENGYIVDVNAEILDYD